MIKLETTFVSGDGGFATQPRTYTQLERTEKTAIYSRSVNGVEKDFEVFKISIKAKGTRIFEKVLKDDEEMYPGTSAFGRSAWSFNDRARAFVRFNQLNDELATVEEKKAIVVPVGEFTVGEFAEANGIAYPVAFVIVKGAIENGSVKFVREERRQARGKASKIYSGVSGK